MSTNDNAVVLYQTPDGATSLAVHLEKETVWLTQAQMVDLFKRDVSVISRHIRNVFVEGELDETSNLQKMQIAGSAKPVVFYSLDLIISVGYWVKSQQGHPLSVRKITGGTGHQPRAGEFFLKRR